jgi:hypothetical protein
MADNEQDKDYKVCALGLKNGDARRMPAYIDMDCLKQYVGIERSEVPAVLVVRSARLALEGTYDENLIEPVKFTKENALQMMDDREFEVNEFNITSSEIIGYRCLGMERQKRDPGHKPCESCPCYMDAGVLKLLIAKSKE